MGYCHSNETRIKRLITTCGNAKKKYPYNETLPYLTLLTLPYNETYPNICTGGWQQATIKKRKIEVRSRRYEDRCNQELETEDEQLEPGPKLEGNQVGLLKLDLEDETEAGDRKGPLGVQGVIPW